MGDDAPDSFPIRPGKGRDRKPPKDPGKGAPEKPGKDKPPARGPGKDQ